MADDDDEDDSDDEDGDVAFFISSRYWWCCILLLLLLLFLLIPLLGTNRKVVQLMKKGPEPPHTDSSPKFLEGKGTRKNPFVLASFTVPPGSTQVCSEKITVTDISSIRFESSPIPIIIFTLLPALS